MVRRAEEIGLNRSPPSSGKAASRILVTGDRQFESGFLQRRVMQTSVPRRQPGSVAYYCRRMAFPCNARLADQVGQFLAPPAGDHGCQRIACAA
jgi:hypothetical protein